MSIRECDGLGAIVQLLRAVTADPGARGQVLPAVAQLARCADNHQPLVTSGAVPVLVDVLKAQPDIRSEASSHAVAALNCLVQGSPRGASELLQVPGSMRVLHGMHAASGKYWYSSHAALHELLQAMATEQHHASLASVASADDAERK